MKININVGTKIITNETVHGYDDTANRKPHTYTVKEVYPHMVLAKDEKGIKRCFSIGDLVCMGLQKQSDIYEAFRAERS